VIANWSYDLRDWAHRRKEQAQVAIAWKLPRWLVKWAAIRLMAHATTGRFSDQVVPELSCVDALRRWDEDA